jgi:alkanesulfonate monooxygenase SsuD/methylene tetrahydromethanopterin reductase-like flavin-dependent oxidoreductase (luciferase family)
MRFGMFDQIEDPGGVALGELYRHRLDLAVRAEQAGFWGYHKSEHHMLPLDAAPSIGLWLSAIAVAGQGSRPPPGVRRDRRYRLFRRMVGVG